jgi:dTDP-4-dehydrorhamnose reductase
VQKLLIHGIDTLVGANFALALRDRYEIVGLAATDDWQLAGCQTLGCDTGSHEQVADHVLAIAPQAIVSCGPLARGSWDLAADARIDAEREVELARALARAAEQTRAHLTVLSTDAQFAGPRMFHSESSPATAASPAAGAARALAGAMARTETLFIRSHVYGWSPAGSQPCFAQRVWEQLSAGGCSAVDARRYATPILASDLAELYHKALETRLTGAYHITGAERTNQYRFAAEVAVAFGLTGRQVNLVAPEVACRAYVDETSLNTRAVRRALETPLPMLREGLLRWATEALLGRRDELDAGRRSTALAQAAAA